MTPLRYVRATAAFSLVEVVLAIGLVSFAVLASFALLSTANDTNRRSRNETFAAQVVSNEFERIRSLGPINFPTTTYVTRYYDVNLRDLGTVKTDEAVYQLDISIDDPPTPAPADKVLNAVVRYPANAVPANQEVVRFATLMNVPL